MLPDEITTLMLVFQVELIVKDADLDLLGVDEGEKICIALRALLADLDVNLLVRGMGTLVV